MRSLPQTVAVSALMSSLLATPLVTSTAGAGVTSTPNCLSAHLVLTRGAQHTVANVRDVALIFTNEGPTCALWGVPAIQPVNASHRALGPLARNLSMGEMPMRHFLARGAAVSVTFGVNNTALIPASTCHAAKAAGVVVSLESFLTARYLALPVTVCTTSASTTTRLLATGTKG